MVVALVLGGLMVRGLIREDREHKQIEVPAPLAQGTSKPGAEPELAGPMEEARINLMDRGDHTRRIGELLLARTEPLADRQYLVTGPRAFIHLDDGRTIFVTADKGRFSMPDRMSEPESGWLTGNVTVLLFDPRQDGRRIDVVRDTPRGTMRTDSLHFDRGLGEVSTPDKVKIWAPELDFRFRGLMAIVNESHQRLERLETTSDHSVVYLPSVREQQEAQAPVLAPPPRGAPNAGEGAAGGTAGGAATSQAPAAPATPPPAPVESMYALTMRDEVSLVQQGRRIDADVLDAWVRLIDGALPENAVGDVRIAGSLSREEGRAAGAEAPAREQPRREAEPGAVMSGPRTATEHSGLARSAGAAESPVNAGAGSAPAAEAPDDAIHMSWRGPMVIVPRQTTPEQLAENHVALRFRAEEAEEGRGGGRVVFNDEESGASGRMMQLDYLATTRQMTFMGPGPAGAQLVMPGSGVMEATRIESDFAAAIVRAIGPSTLVPDGGEQMKISASEGSTFVLAQRDGAVTSELKEAFFVGDVHLSGDDGEATAGFARAHFVSTQQHSNQLAMVVLEEKARIASSAGEWLAGDRIDVRFQPGANGSTPEPSRLHAIGNVRASRGEGEATERMSAGRADAVLSRSGGRGLEIAEAVLLQDVEIVREGSSIRGQDVRIEPGGRVLHVRSAGEFEHRDGESQLTASWTRQMWFDDLAGRLECEGDVHAVSRPDSMTTEEVQAEHLVARITPGTDGGAPGSSREVLHVEAGTPPGQRAVFQMQRFAEANGRRFVEQMMRLEGERIVADNQSGTLHVPVAGRLVMVDQEAEAGVPGDPVAPAGPMMTGRGHMLLDWAGWLSMNRITGDLEAEQGIQAIHQRPADGEVTELTCDQLTAKITPAGEAGEQTTGRFSLEGDHGIELLSARARGSVFVGSGPAIQGGQAGQPPQPRKELTADELTYDAVTGVVQATALQDNFVTYFDPAAQVPTMARAIWWNMVSGEMRLEQPAPTTMPR